MATHRTLTNPHEKPHPDMYVEALRQNWLGKKAALKAARDAEFAAWQHYEAALVEAAKTKAVR